MSERLAGGAAPSVLFVISHDIAPRHGCYGGQAITPNFDALASEGTRFDSHYCHWPLCGPSRANLFTGCRPLRTKRFNNEPFFPFFRARMGRDFLSLPQAFRTAGYVTRGAGLVYHDVDDAPSWDEPLWKPPVPNAGAARRTDLPLRLRAGENRDWVTHEAYELISRRWEELQAQGFREEDLSDPALARRAQGPAVESTPGEDDSYWDGLVTSRLIRELERIPPDRPFFLAAGFITGHTPFRAPEKYWDLYDRHRLVLPENDQPPAGSPDWVMGDSEPAQYYTTHGYERPWRASPEQSLELLHAHLAAMSYTDAQLGRLVAALRDSGRYEETIIVAVSDHGFHDGHHGYWGKHNLWDQSLRVPLAMRVPGGKPSVVTGLTEHVDLFPTLCELCDLPLPRFVQGESLVPLMRDPTAPGKDAVYAHRAHMWHDRIQAYHLAHTVRTRRYRYTEYRDRHGEPIYRELFDYERDPLERANHVDEAALAPVVAELRVLLEEQVRGAG
ncbi:MAG: DUF4976 domain-containing protein [Spirochaetaceae bacterium]|nr:MAG: DUF4976 domain-containing protein [Spirochaetaceae bacterium]